MTKITYYIKAATIILAHPVKVLRHPKSSRIIRDVIRAKFRLHWLRDVARGAS